MGLGDRRRERREDRRGGGLRTFRMRQKLVSIGDDYWIEDDQGQRVYKINGKAMRIRDTLILEDPDGHELELAERVDHQRRSHEYAARSLD